MSSRRNAKIAEAVRESVSSTVLFGLKDPRVKNVTVLRAEVAPDLRSAKVYVSVRGDERVQTLTMHGLRAARGFIQSQVADRLQTRYTPVLNFVLDTGVQLSVQTSAILRDVLADAPPPPDDTALPEPGTPESAELEPAQLEPINTSDGGLAQDSS